MIALALRLAPYIIGAVLIGFGYYKAQTWCNAACEKQQERADTLQAEKDAAIANRNALALKWADAIQKTERVYVESAVRREDDFRGIRGRAPSGRGASVRVPVDAVSIGMLNDAHRLANPDSPAASRIDEAAPAVSAPATVSVEECRDTYINGAEAYLDAWLGWRGVTKAYEAIRVPKQETVSGN